MALTFIIFFQWRIYCTQNVLRTPKSIIPNGLLFNESLVKRLWMFAFVLSVMNFLSKLGLMVKYQENASIAFYFQKVV